jgi:uncharacterized protein YecA (UPF0149 family)
VEDEDQQEHELDGEEDGDRTEDKDWMKYEDGEDEAEDDREELPEPWLAPDARVELATSLPHCVARIHRFWRWRAGRSAAPPPGQRKVGRNELCPCGSGKKFKRCCGA